MGGNCPNCCEALAGELIKSKARCRIEYHAPCPRCVTDWRAFCDENTFRCDAPSAAPTGRAPVVEERAAPVEPLEFGECECCGAPTLATLRLCNFCERAEPDDSDDEDYEAPTPILEPCYCDTMTGCGCGNREAPGYGGICEFCDYHHA